MSIYSYSYLFSWQFWNGFFVVLGIIFFAMLLLGAFMWWVTEDFDAIQQNPNGDITDHICAFTINDEHRVKLLINYKNKVWTSRVLSGDTGWGDHTWDNKEWVMYTTLGEYINEQVKRHSICYAHKQNNKA